MEIWGWLLVYAVVLGVLQLLVYRYLAGDDVREGPRGLSGGRGTNPRGDPRPGVFDDPQYQGRRSDIENGRHCAHCGAMNEADAAFTRCWRCTRRLH